MISLLLIVLAATAPDAPPPKMLVTPLAGDGVEAAVTEPLDEALVAAAGRVQGYKVISRAEVAALLDLEIQKGALGCESTNTACMAELGEAAGADLLLGGRVALIGDTFILTLTVVDPKNAKLVGRSSVTADSVGPLTERMDAAVAEALGVKTAEARRDYTLKIPAEGVKAAVMPLAVRSIEADVGASLTGLVTQELKNLHGFTVISQDEIQAMLQFESDKQEIGCSDASCFAEIGGALGVDYLVVGSVGRVDDTFLVSLKLLHTAEANVVNRVSETFKGRASDLIPATKFAVYQLVGLKPDAPGKLTVQVVPAEAAVQLNEQPLAARELPDLAPGRYSLRADAEGYYPSYLETYVEPGATNTLLLELTEVPTPWYLEWWVWTIAGAVVAGATAGTYAATQGGAGPEGGSIGIQVTRAAR